jgi:hypothetical protein
MCRLPKLCRVNLHIRAVNPVGLEMLLSTMRRFMPGIVGMFVKSTATWLVASASWQQLGSMTQL